MKRLLQSRAYKQKLVRRMSLYLPPCGAAFACASISPPVSSIRRSPALVKRLSQIRMHASSADAAVPQAEAAWEHWRKMGAPKFHVAPMVDQVRYPICNELRQPYDAQIRMQVHTA